VANDFAELPVPSRLAIPSGCGVGEAIFSHATSGFWVEPEYDGLRCQAMLSESGWVFAGKTPSSAARPEYANIPGRCPEIVESLSGANLPSGTLFDGKLVCGDGWQSLSRRLTCSSDRFRDMPETRFEMVVSDVIEFGRDKTDIWPLFERRRLLEGVVPRSGAVRVPVSKSGDDGLNLALELLRDDSVEGVLLKRILSQYPGGGSTKDWLVHRRKEVHLAVVLDVSEGRGKLRGMAGSLVIGQYFPDGKMRRVASLDGMASDQRHYAWVNRRSIAGTVVAFVSQGRTETSYRRPRLLDFRPEADPGLCQWEGT